MGNLVYKQRHKHLGLCRSCSRKAVDGFDNCAIHRESLRLQAIARIIRRKKERRCTRCGIKLHPEMDKDHFQCVSCSGRGTIPTTKVNYATAF